MNCRLSNENFADLFEENLERSKREELLSHLDTCPECSAEYEQLRLLADQIRPGIQVTASQGFKDRVIQRIQSKESNQLPLRRRKRIMMNTSWKKIAAVTTILVIAGALIPLIGHYGWKHNEAHAANTLIEKSIKAMSGLVSVYMDYDVRTLPGDNFELIDVKADYVNHKLWRIFGDPGRWKIEKEGRVVVMDGKKQYLYIKVPQSAIIGGPDAGFVDWMRVFLDPQKILEKEKTFAEKYKASYKTTETESTIILTIKAKANGDFANNYMLNKSIPESDNRRVYTFDKSSKRLKSFEIYVETDQKEVQVIKVNEIRYDLNIPAETFVISLPENVKWINVKELAGNMENGVDAVTPEDVARMFFEACGKEDWNTVDMLFPGLLQSGNADQIKEMLGGIRVKSIGTAFKSGQYPGQFVPYEIVFKTGETKKMNLAIRNDNRDKKWTVDGGL